MRVLRLISASALGYLLGTVPSAAIASHVAANGRASISPERESKSRGSDVFRLLGSTAGRAVIVAECREGLRGLCLRARYRG